MDFETFIESEAAAALKRCEVLAAGWGLRVAIRDCREVPAVRMAECFGLFVPSADARKFGIPAGCGLAVVDAEPLLALSDPIGRIASVAAHEVAHGVQDDLETICFGPAIQTPEDFEAKVWTPEKLVEVGRPAWLGHGPEFLRAAAHVAFRMWKADLPISLAWLANPESYGLGPFSWYFSELREECERLAHLPIVAALQARAPQAFLKLWAADVARAAAEKNSGSSRSFASSCHYSEEPSSAKS